jgi:hypothetical protein
VAVGSRGGRAGSVEGLERAGEQQHRCVAEFGVGLDGLADLVATQLRHHHVREDDVGADLANLRKSVLAVVHRGDGDVFVRKGDRDHLLDRDAVVSQEKLFGHWRGPLLV